MSELSRVFVHSVSTHTYERCCVTQAQAQAQAETSDGAAGVAGGHTLIIHVGLPFWTEEWGPSDDATVGDFVKTTKRFYSDLLAQDTLLAWGKKPLDASDERTLVEAGFTGGEEIQSLTASDDLPPLCRPNVRSSTLRSG